MITKLDGLGRWVRSLKALADHLKAARWDCARCRGGDTTTPGGRLFFHTLLIADFEHDLIVECTHDWLAAAWAHGREGGPKFMMSPNRVKQARAM